VARCEEAPPSALPRADDVVIRQAVCGAGRGVGPAGILERWVPRRARAVGFRV
jgi:hypothetical protein